MDSRDPTRIKDPRSESLIIIYHQAVEGTSKPVQGDPNSTRPPPTSIDLTTSSPLLRPTPSSSTSSCTPYLFTHPSTHTHTHTSQLLHVKPYLNQQSWVSLKRLADCVATAVHTWRNTYDPSFLTTGRLISPVDITFFPPPYCGTSYEIDCSGVH